MKFPKSLGYFNISGYNRKDGTYFNKQDTSFYLINKKLEQKRQNTYDVNVDYLLTDVNEFFAFVYDDLLDYTLDFDVVVLKDKPVEINCNIISQINVSYSKTRVYINFTILENYEL